MARLGLRKPLAVGRQLLVQLEKPEALDGIADRIMARPIRWPTQQMLRQEVLPEPCVVFVLQTTAQTGREDLRIKTTVLHGNNSVMWSVLHLCGRPSGYRLAIGLEGRSSPVQRSHLSIPVILATRVAALPGDLLHQGLPAAIQADTERALKSTPSFSCSHSTSRPMFWPTSVADRGKHCLTAALAWARDMP